MRNLGLSIVNTQFLLLSAQNAAVKYKMDSAYPAAVISVPRGEYLLSSGGEIRYSSIGALLLFSSAAKYVVGPDGNYRLSPANAAALDWSTGRQRILIEAIGATNYWPYSEALEAPYIGNQFSVVNTANSLFGTLNRATLTATIANAAVYSGYGYLPVVAGDVVTFTAAIENGSGQFVRGGLYGTASTWGADGDTTCVVLSGPGTVSQNGGGLWDFSGVTSDTVIRWTRTYQSAEYAAPFLYTNCAIGQTVSVGRIQLERGHGSSYIPTGASPTARAADVVTAASGLLALLTAANAALAFRGTILVSQDNIQGFGAVICDGTVGGYGLTVHLPNVAGERLYANRPGIGFAYEGYTDAGVAGADVGLAIGSSSAGVKQCSRGSAINNSASGAVFFNPSSPAVRIGGHPYSGNYANLFLDELIVWPILASDAGLQAQARVYL